MCQDSAPGWHEKQAGPEDDFPKCLLIEQPFLSVPKQATRGKDLPIRFCEFIQFSTGAYDCTGYTGLPDVKLYSK